MFGDQRTRPALKGRKPIVKMSSTQPPPPPPARIVDSFLFKGMMTDNSTNIWFKIINDAKIDTMIIIRNNHSEFKTFDL